MDSVLGLQLSQQGAELFFVTEGIDLFQDRKNRLVSQFVCEVRIHASSKEITVFVLERRLRVVCGLFKVGVEKIAVIFGQLIKSPPAHLVRWDGIIFTPVSASILVEVGAGVSGGIDGRKVEAVRGFRSNGS